MKFLLIYINFDFGLLSIKQKQLKAGLGRKNNLNAYMNTKTNQAFGTSSFTFVSVANRFAFSITALLS